MDGRGIAAVAPGYLGGLQDALAGLDAACVGLAGVVKRLQKGPPTGNVA